MSSKDNEPQRQDSNLSPLVPDEKTSEPNVESTSEAELGTAPPTVVWQPVAVQPVAGQPVAGQPVAGQPVYYQAVGPPQPYPPKPPAAPQIVAVAKPRVDHVCHAIITLFFPPWIFVWIIACIFAR